jgi:hypothetical protein
MEEVLESEWVENGKQDSQAHAGVELRAEGIERNKAPHGIQGW